MNFKHQKGYKLEKWKYFQNHVKMIRGAYVKTSTVKHINLRNSMANNSVFDKFGKSETSHTAERIQVRTDTVKIRHTGAILGS